MDNSALTMCDENTTQLYQDSQKPSTGIPNKRTRKQTPRTFKNKGQDPSTVQGGNCLDEKNNHGFNAVGTSQRFRTIPKKKSIDSLIKDMEKELAGMQTYVIDGFNKLERKIQCHRKPKSQLLIEQKSDQAEIHVEQLIIEFEMQQLAESLV